MGCVRGVGEGNAAASGNPSLECAVFKIILNNGRTLCLSLRGCQCEEAQWRNDQTNRGSTTHPGTGRLYCSAEMEVKAAKKHKAPPNQRNRFFMHGMLAKMAGW